MNKLVKAMDTVGLIGHDGKLSLTTLAFIAIVIKILTLAELDLAAIGALLVVILNYMHRRSVANSAKEVDIDDVDHTVTDKLAELSDSLKGVELIALEAKERASKLGLAMGMSVKTRD